MQQIKSKERVKNFGEVFTAKKEVEAMLDLVKNEACRIDSRFLEPSCGNGNFLVAILERKLKTIVANFKSSSDYEYKVFLALSSIYGVDILADNVEVAKNRMFDIVCNYWNKSLGAVPVHIKSEIKRILDKNIIQGDFLNGQSKIPFLT